MKLTLHKTWPTYGVGAVGLLIGSLVIVGWVFRVPTLVSIYSEFSPMKFNTALLFAMLGASLSLMKVRPRVAAGIALVGKIFAGLTLLEYLLSFNLGIDTLIINPFLEANAAFPGRMSPNGALSMLLLFASVLVLLQDRGRVVATLFVQVATTLVIALSLASLAGYLTVFDATFGWGNYTGMAVHTALLFILFAVALNTVSTAGRFLDRDWLIPARLARGLVALTIVFWLFALQTEGRQTRKAFAEKTDAIKTRIETAIKERELSLIRMARRWEAQRGTPERLWKLDAHLYLEHLPGIQGIGLIDRDSVVRMGVPELTAKAIHFRMFDEERRAEALHKAAKTGIPQLTKMVEFKSGSIGFLLVVPMSLDEKPAGFITAGLNYSRFFSSVLDFHDYQLTLFEDDKTLFTSAVREPLASAQWSSSAIVTLPGIEWRIQMCPSVYFLRGLGTTFPLSVLIVGFILSYLLSHLVHAYFAATRMRAENTALLTWQSTIIDGTSLAIISTDPSGTVRSLNPAAERLLEYRADEVIGIYSPALWHDPEEVKQRAEELTKELNRPVAPGFEVFTAPLAHANVNIGEWTILSKSGQRKTVRLAAHRMSSEGETLGYVGILEDISEKKRYEIATQEALNRARETSLAKSEFLANMSHEIRTPINGVMGMASLLLDTPLIQSQRQYTEAILASSESLLSIVNNILDLSKVEARKLDLENIDFSPRDLLTSVMHVMELHASGKGLTLKLALDEAVAPRLTGDPTRLRQVLMNLVGNAVKFTAQGQIQIIVTAHSPAKGAQRLRIEVVDSGVGIPRELENRLFEKFSQADSSTTRKFGGTGLGLSICKQLVLAMSGEIGYLSNKVGGSTFWFEVELAIGKSASQRQSELAVSIGAKLRILLVEDNGVNQLIARAILEKRGHQVTLAENGVRALAALDESEFDLILMDCQMPEMDGYEASARIRAHPDARIRTLPIVAMTANAMTGDREKCLAAGMTDYISKPLKPDELMGAIARVCGGPLRKAA